MSDPDTRIKDIKATTEAVVTGARASALVESEGRNDYHADRPSDEVMEQLGQLLDYEAIDALIHFMPSLTQTISMNIQRTAQREHSLLGTPKEYASVRGLAASMTMSLSDFVIALAEVAGVETPAVEELKVEIEKARADGTLTQKIALNKTAGVIPESDTVPNGSDGLILP